MQLQEMSSLVNQLAESIYKAAEFFFFFIKNVSVWHCHKKKIKIMESKRLTFDGKNIFGNFELFQINYVFIWRRLEE